MNEELRWLDATALAELVKKGEVTPTELVENSIQQIEALNPKLNAVVTTTFDQALEAAKGKIPEGPFQGVPFLLKDLQALQQGVRLTAGSRFLSDFVPDHDSEIVKRFRQAGLLLLGKTNTPELGILPTTEPDFLGACKNPWDITRTTGGSSGGSAAAVASGMVPFAHGNDGGGSIRIPAACCGLFGLKPTRARISLGPDFGDVMHGFVVEHALTRSVRDSAALLDAIAGPAPGDPYFASPPIRPYLQEIQRDPGDLTIAFTAKAPTGSPVDRDCIEAVQCAINLCAELGYPAEELELKIDSTSLIEAFLTIWSGSCAAVMEGLAEFTGKPLAEEEFEPLTWALYQMGKQKDAPSYLLALNKLQSLARQIALYFEEIDLLITPTLAEPPLPLGTFSASRESPLQGLMRAASFAAFTPLCNITGQPAMSVPLYWNREGLPIGTHFIAKYGDEAALFRFAAQLEKACPWRHRHPL